MMKQIMGLALISLLFCTKLVQAEIQCKLRYDIRNYMNWYDFASNIAYGMTEQWDGEDFRGCKICDDLANKVAELHYSVVDLED